MHLELPIIRTIMTFILEQKIKLTEISVGSTGQASIVISQNSP
jgi:hypothetical protein